MLTPKLKLNLKPVVAEKPAEEKPAETPAAEKPVSAIQLALQKLQPATPATTPLADQPSTKVKLSTQLKTAKTEAAASESAALSKATEEIPEDIFTLDQGIYSIEGLNADAFAEHLAATYKALHDDQPNLATMLAAINKNLRKYEELSFLLNTTQLNLFYQGLIKVTGSEIKTAKPKKNAAKIQQQVAKEGGLDLGSM